ACAGRFDLGDDGAGHHARLMGAPLYQPELLPVPLSRLGESPFWHPEEGALYWCDIAARSLNRYDPRLHEHRHWSFDAEPGCAAPLPGGELLVALRDGLWRFDPKSGRQQRVAPAPYDMARQRFNDGKADPQG